MLRLPPPRALRPAIPDPTPFGSARAPQARVGRRDGRMSGGRRKEEPPQPQLANGALKVSVWSKVLRSDAAWDDKVRKAPARGEGAGSGERVWMSLVPAGRGRGSGERVARVPACSGRVRAGARGASSSSAVCPAGSGVVRASEDCERAGCGIPKVDLSLHIGRGGTFPPRLDEKDEMPRESGVSDHLRRVGVRKKCRWTWVRSDWGLHDALAGHLQRI